ncbi:hypothetical protein [Pseudomonas sp. KNUC1026]|uniref:hypothetical protein n=1 Tax=Pseudomonas sp. KNUC1026 TaxID=2893890 RepID=UPI001F202D78|nr:hypothetical protein [Pseudomonas sp. KNUC1026]UFH50841.1 hypothetical protein LN139_06900 [Pseudomonas sp. KNUC1026]
MTTSKHLHLDPTYGNEGFAHLPTRQGSPGDQRLWRHTHMLEDDDSLLVLAQEPEGSALFLLRYDRNGQLDTQFGDEGYRRLDIRYNHEHFYSTGLFRGIAKVPAEDGGGYLILGTPQLVGHFPKDAQLLVAEVPALIRLGDDFEPMPDWGEDGVLIFPFRSKDYGDFQLGTLPNATKPSTPSAKSATSAGDEEHSSHDAWSMMLRPGRVELITDGRVVLVEQTFSRTRWSFSLANGKQEERVLFQHISDNMPTTYDLLRLSDGRTLVLTADPYLIRAYKPDGTFDKTFGDLGQLLIGAPSSLATAHGEGFIVLKYDGSTPANQRYTAICAFDSKGKANPAFNGGNWQTLKRPGYNTVLNREVMQDLNGGWLICGKTFAFQGVAFCRMKAQSRVSMPTVIWIPSGGLAQWQSSLQ